MTVEIHASSGQRQANPEQVVRRNVYPLLHDQRAFEQSSALVGWQYFPNTNAAAALQRSVHAFGMIDRSAAWAGPDKIAKVARLDRQSKGLAWLNKHAIGRPKEREFG